MLVKEIMSKNIMRIDCNDSVIDACNEYTEKNVGSLVVMDKEIIVGIVTERDIIKRLILQDRDPKKTKIREIMTPNIITVHALAPIEKAAQIMREQGIKKLPVILNNEIVGMLTETDLSRTIDNFSEAMQDMKELYLDSKEKIEKVFNNWEDLIIKLTSYQQLKTEKLEKEVIEKEN